MSPLQRPPEFRRNSSFFYFLGTQALGAFNDNLFKQTVLLLGLGFLMCGVEYQAVVQFLFAVPFLLFSGLAGDIADRYSKGKLIVLFKVAEVLVMMAGVLAFLTITSSSKMSSQTPLYLVFLACVVFFMGTQSAFFGPPKYGGLVQIVREGDLSAATGLTQMTTFLAIILGVACAGWLTDAFRQHLYAAGLFAVGIALLGTLTSLGITHWPPVDPDRHISGRSLLSVFPTLGRVAREDHLLMRVMLIYSWFWLVGGVCLPSINVFGILQMGLGNFMTSLMVATLSIGIAVGSVTVGWLSRDRVRLDFVAPSLIALVLFLLALLLIPCHTPTTEEIARYTTIKLGSPTLDSAASFIPRATPSACVAAYLVFFFLGTSAGFFSVPLLAFVQARPSLNDKGQVFAAVNWLNWVFIVISAVLYGTGISITSSRADLVMACIGVLTLLAGAMILPGILKAVRRERPACVFGPPEGPRRNNGTL